MLHLSRLAVLAGGIALFLRAQTMPKLNYPPAPKSDQVDDYHGTRIADPYRTLENADAPATQSWVDRENELTFAWLARQPEREAIRARLTSLWNYERYTGLYKAGNHYFYFHNSGLQNQAVLYVMDSLNGSPREFLDPNTYRKDGTAALNGEAVSWNGKLFGYAVAQAGSDWDEWRVRDVATGKDLNDVIRWSKGASISWAADDSGFYYSRFPEPPPEKLLTVAALNQKIYFHKLGEPQSADKLVYARPDHPEWGLTPIVMEGGRYLLFYIDPAIYGKNLISWQDLSAAQPRTVDLISTVEHSYNPVAVMGSTLYLQTNDSAPRGRVIAIDLSHPERAHWKEIVPEREETLEGAQMAGGKLLLSYMKDAHSAARLVSVEGKQISEIELPGLGTAAWSSPRLHDSEAFYDFTSYTVPSSTYRLDLNTGHSTLIRQSKATFDAPAYETKQVFYKSKDGTRVPMFLSYRKGLKLDGRNPALLYAREKAERL